METHKIKGEDHYQCKEVKAERDALRAENESLKANQPRWASVDTPPDEGGTYLAVIALKYCEVVDWRNGCWWFVDDDSPYTPCVTHWMPLPPLPTEVK